MVAIEKLAKLFYKVVSMEKNSFTKCFLILSMYLVLNVGCTTHNGIPELIVETDAFSMNSTPRSVTATIEPDLLESKPTQTPIDRSGSGPFPVPTLTNLQQQLLRLKLNDENCVFPCYLGIIPGETTIDEALLILQTMGASLDYLSPNTYDYGLNQYSIELDIIRKDIELRQSIYLLCDGEAIIRMHVLIEARLFPDFPDYWSRYFLKNILSQISAPEYILLSTVSYQPTYSIHIFDDSHGIEYAIFRMKDDDLVCPQNTTEIVAIGFTYYDPKYYDMINTVDNWLIYNPQDYKTVGDVLGLSNQEFIAKVLDGSIECFDVPD